MCGRYSETVDPMQLAEVLSIDLCTYQFTPRPVIAPTQPAPVIVRENGLGKIRRLLGDFAFRVEHKTAAIKNQLIVPADRIAINQRALNFRNRGGQHLPAHAIFPKAPRRCGNVDENLHALLNQ